MSANGMFLILSDEPSFRDEMRLVSCPKTSYVLV